MDFEWDHDKAASNLKKHGVTFDEATTVFVDPLALIFDDEEHSSEEQRELIIGHSIAQRLLIVSFAERGEDMVRIIRERKDYEENS